GSDTNARKNRSGTWMEKEIEHHLVAAAKAMPGSRIIRQKSFGHIAQLGVAVPKPLVNRKFDIFYSWKSANINIETNYYGGGGSKPQEIIDSYIDRQRQLATCRCRFILITDGMGWAAGENQLRRGIDELDFVMNLRFVEAGLLEAAIKECAK
ncbi:MAG: DpnII family type II restriction endonuclease, partial [Planctomycetota bacterium]|nr:DpnII family type II restriction endonuclease [Planctomycetota bacterium]